MISVGDKVEVVGEGLWCDSFKGTVIGTEICLGRNLCSVSFKPRSNFVSRLYESYLRLIEPKPIEEWE